jgi:hypothetical protein
VSESQYIHLENLNSITGGDPAFTLALLTKMQANIPVSFDVMEKAVVDKNWLELKAASHKSKSTFAYLDIQKLRTMLQDIEHCAMEGEKMEELPGMVAEALTLGRIVLGELNTVIEELKK